MCGDSWAGHWAAAAAASAKAQGRVGMNSNGRGGTEIKHQLCCNAMSTSSFATGCSTAARVDIRKA